MLRVTAVATILPLLASLPLLTSQTAFAQGLTSGGIAGGGFHPVTGVAPKSTTREAPPPGLPGSQSRDTAAPPEGPLDVPPTEALFDAINRGDMAGARDALSRGADLNGRNVLGMTPIDLSVDLSRNDITFLLLSMRSQSAVAGPPEPAAPQTKAAKKAIAQAQAAQKRRAVPQTVVTTAAAPTQRYAAVPSTPAPQAGFLGFGSTATP